MREETKKHAFKRMEDCYNAVLIKKCGSLNKRAEKANNDIFHTLFEFEKQRMKMDDPKSSQFRTCMYDTHFSIVSIMSRLKDIIKSLNLGKCDDIMVARIKMAECEIISLEKQIEIAKGTLK